MSYEHCERHDEPATNGCESCRLEELAGEHRRFAALTATLLGFFPAHLLEAWSNHGFQVVSTSLNEPLFAADGERKQPMSEEEFKIGDVVELKSGGPAMTITALGDEALGGGDGDVEATWFDGKAFDSETLPRAALKRRDPKVWRTPTVG